MLKAERKKGCYSKEGKSGSRSISQKKEREECRGGGKGWAFSPSIGKKKKRKKVGGGSAAFNGTGREERIPTNPGAAGRKGRGNKKKRVAIPKKGGEKV